MADISDTQGGTSSLASRLVSLFAKPARKAPPSKPMKRNCAVTDQMWNEFVDLGPGGPVMRHR